MDVSDKDFECVVNKLFDDEDNPNKIPAKRLIKKIAPFIGRNSLELGMLQRILDPDTSNPYVPKDALKIALVEWKNNIQNGNDLSFVEEMSIFSKSNGDQCTTYSSLSSNGYRDRVIEMQNDLAEKEHLIRNIKKQLQHSTQVTQQHEDTLVQMAQERDKLMNKLTVAQNNSNTCEALKKEYAEQVECLNIYKEKCVSLENDIDNLKKENVTLNAKLLRVENEKHSLSYLLATANEEKEKVEEQLLLSHSNLEVCMSENVQFREKILEHENAIQSLSSIKHSLEVDLQNSFNKSVHLSQYMEKCDDNLDDSIGETLSSQLMHSTSDTKSIKLRRRHSETSIGKEYIPLNNENLHENFVTSTPKNYTSLMEELHQLPTEFSNTNGYNNFFVSTDDDAYSHPIKCEAESTSDPSNCYEPDVILMRNHTESSFVGNEKTFVVKDIKVCMEKETQTDEYAIIDHYAIVSRSSDDNKIVCIQHNGARERISRLLTAGLDKFFAWGTCICISYACLYLYNTMRYCHSVRQGTAVRLYPSEWFTLREILESIFEVRHTGPAPI